MLPSCAGLVLVQSSVFHVKHSHARTGTSTPPTPRDCRGTAGGRAFTRPHGYSGIRLSARFDSMRPHLSDDPARICVAVCLPTTRDGAVAQASHRRAHKTPAVDRSSPRSAPRPAIPTTRGQTPHRTPPRLVVYRDGWSLDKAPWHRHVAPARQWRRALLPWC